MICGGPGSCGTYVRHRGGRNSLPSPCPWLLPITKRPLSSSEPADCCCPRYPHTSGPPHLWAFSPLGPHASGPGPGEINRGHHRRLQLALLDPLLPLPPSHIGRGQGRHQRALSFQAVGDGSKDAAGRTRIVEAGLTNSNGKSRPPGSCKAMLDPDGRISGRTTAECGRRGAMDQAI